MAFRYNNAYFASEPEEWREIYESRARYHKIRNACNMLNHGLLHDDMKMLQYATVFLHDTVEECAKQNEVVTLETSPIHGIITISIYYADTEELLKCFQRDNGKF